MHEFEDFLDILNTKRMLKHGFRQRIKKALIKRTFDKGDSWLAGSGAVMEVPFLHTGTAFGFHPSESRRHVSHLWEKGEVILCGSNLFEDEAQKTYIQFLEPSVTYTMNTKDLIKLCNKYVDARFMVQYFLAEALKKVEEHNHRLSSLPPERRLEEVSFRYPIAFSRLTHIEKASFLGISRQTLYNIS